jgi:predicted TIM-barrel fold metal-dependent hydrolase
MGADDPRIHPIYAVAEEVGRPVIIHAGREPSSPAYGLDVRALCGVDQVERVLQRFPRLQLVVPHLGADEFVEYERLLQRYENLWMDTTMVVAGFFPGAPSDDVIRRNAKRLMYGTDFPNIPYAWDRELHRLRGLKLPEADEHALFVGNAERLFA